MDCQNGSDSNQRRRAVAYLKRFGFSDEAQIEVLIPRLLGPAKQAMPDPPGIEPAMERRAAAWFSAVLQIDDVDQGRVVRIGRAAFLMSEAASRWPDMFLHEGQLPADMVSALRRAVPIATPAERPIDMVAQSLPLPSFTRFVPRLRRLAPVGGSESKR